MVEYPRKSQILGKTSSEVEPGYREIAKAKERTESDFHAEASAAISTASPDYPYGHEIIIDEHVSEVLESNRPATLFFDPSEIYSKTPNKHIVGKHRPRITRHRGQTYIYDHEEWEFKVHPNRKTLTPDEYPRRASFTKGDIPSKDYDPFLVVRFVASYDNERQIVIFKPTIDSTRDSYFPDSDLERAFLEFLGINEGPEIPMALDIKAEEEEVEMLNGTREMRLKVVIYPQPTS